MIRFFSPLNFYFAIFYFILLRWSFVHRDGGQWNCPRFSLYFVSLSRSLCRMHEITSWLRDYTSIYASESLLTTVSLSTRDHFFYLFFRSSSSPIRPGTQTKHKLQSARAKFEIKVQNATRTFTHSHKKPDSFIHFLRPLFSLLTLFHAHTVRTANKQTHIHTHPHTLLTQMTFYRWNERRKTSTQTKKKKRKKLLK